MPAPGTVRLPDCKLTRREADVKSGPRDFDVLRAPRAAAASDCPGFLGRKYPEMVDRMPV